MNKSDAMFDAWLLHTKPVIPVIVIDDAEDATSLAGALTKGGIRLIEITLRTPAALKAIHILAGSFPDIIVGAGTVVRPEQVVDVAKAGGRFIVSPGFSLDIAEQAEKHGLAYLPGVATATEIMTATSNGFNFLKFYPAAQAGGVDMLKALSGPFPNVTFCPTGGISELDYLKYLELSNVKSIGGSWVASRKLIADKQWNEIYELSARI